MNLVQLANIEKREFNIYKDNNSLLIKEQNLKNKISSENVNKFKLLKENPKFIPNRNSESSKNININTMTKNNSSSKLLSSYKPYFSPSMKKINSNFSIERNKNEILKKSERNNNILTKSVQLPMIKNNSNKDLLSYNKNENNNNIYVTPNKKYIIEEPIIKENIFLKSQNKNNPQDEFLLINSKIEKIENKEKMDNKEKIEKNSSLKSSSDKKITTLKNYIPQINLNNENSTNIKSSDNLPIIVLTSELKTNNNLIHSHKEFKSENTKNKNFISVTNKISTRSVSKNNSVNSTDEESKKGKKLISNFAYSTQAGTNENGQIKTNQDSHIIINNVFNLDNFNIFGVLDGHGTNGHFVSQEVSKYLTTYFEKHQNYFSNFLPSNKINIVDENISTLIFKDNKSLLNNNNLKEEVVYEKLIENNYSIIRNSYKNADDYLGNKDFDVNMSGSTSNLVFILSGKIICANLGDSRAILVENKESGKKSGGMSSTRSLINYSNNNNQNKLKLKIKNLSNDHKPELEEEKRRIINSGGIVKRSNDDVNSDSPFRVFLKYENYPGLAMSRALGDKIAKKCGVINDPEIIEMEINEASKFIVIASDGIWEFLDNNRVAEIVNSFYLKNNPYGACQAVIKEATEMWKKEDCVVDDITISVVFMNL